jgi:hypothetical protein
MDMFIGRGYDNPMKQLRTWNTRWAGKRALTSLTADGYHAGEIWCIGHKASRVAYALSNGEWPMGCIDHINGNRGDDRIVNLRDVSRLDNQRNMKTPSHNTSGYIGVSKYGRNGKWRVNIKCHRKQIHIGVFESLKEAVKARLDAQRTMGFHTNHGR